MNCEHVTVRSMRFCEQISKYLHVLYSVRFELFWKRQEKYLDTTEVIDQL